MKENFLIINPHHTVYTQIPMGTYGLCDYLSKYDIDANILNLSLYSDDDYLSRLDKEIKKRKPSFVGIVIHWMDTLENALYVCTYIKRKYPNLVVLAGGITASYFGKALKQYHDDLDFIVRGEPEIPMEMLMRGTPVSEVPNLIYKSKGGIKANRMHHNNSAVLNDISFCKLDYLIDRHLQGEWYASFPFFIGRGCIYDCVYCGGSKKAFREHSDRTEVALRSIPSIIKDLKILLNYRDSFFICHETSKNYMCELFKAIAADPVIASKFTCHYGTWSLMDEELIDLYVNAFKFSSENRSVIEISPETSIDKDRAAIKDHRLSFSNDELMESITTLDAALGDTARVYMFYSRFHKTHNHDKLRNELINIHMMRQRIFESSLDLEVKIEYGDLSTDAGSQYWDQAFSHHGNGDAIERLLRLIRSRKEINADNCGMDNLCAYLPKGIDITSATKHRQVSRIMHLLSTALPLYYFLLAKSIGADGLISVIEEVVGEMMADGRYEGVLIELVRYPPEHIHKYPGDLLLLLIDMFQIKIAERHSKSVTDSKKYFDEMGRIFKMPLKFSDYRCSESKAISGRPVALIKRPVLNKKRTCVANYNYLSQDLYDSIERGLENLTESKTFYIFCSDSLQDFNFETYYQYFNEFNGKNTVEDVLRIIDGSADLSVQQRENLKEYISDNLYYLTK